MADLLQRVKRKMFSFHLRVARYWNSLRLMRSSGEAPGLTVLICFRNEMEHLPGFCQNVLSQVDGVIGLDDASTDGSPQFFCQQPKLISLIRKQSVQPHVWNEPENKRLLIQEALTKVPNTWVLVLDADERLGSTFRQQINVAIKLAERYGYSALSLRLAELWDSPDQFRVDGIWGRKRRVRLFKLTPDYQLDTGEFHTSWHSTTLDPRKDIAPVNIYFYHLGMLTAEQRQHRREKYQRLDPARRWQKIGYDYLTDISGLRLQPVKESISPDTARYPHLPP